MTEAGTRNRPAKCRSYQFGAHKGRPYNSFMAAHRILIIIYKFLKGGVGENFLQKVSPNNHAFELTTSK
jgi:hypothetical protein